MTILHRDTATEGGDPMIVTRAAALVPASLNEEARTVDVIWTTGARVTRYTWDGPYIEELVVSRSAIDLKRLNAGAPFLNGHRDGGDALKVVGVVVKGSARIEDEQGIATIRFDEADDEDAERLFRKVKRGIVSGISVGYRILKVQRTKELVEEVPVFRVSKWEPFEISLAPIQADLGSHVRSFPMTIKKNPGSNGEGNTEGGAPEVRTAAEPAPAPAPVAVQTRAEPAAQPAAMPAAPDADAVRASELHRVQQIRTVARAAKLNDTQTDALIDSGVSVEAARSKILDMVVERDAAQGAPRGVANVGASRDIGAESFRAGAMNALMHRMNPAAVKVDDVGRSWAGLTLLEMGRKHLASNGVRVDGMGKREIATLMLQSRSGMSSSDFPSLLADVANKRLQEAYAGEVQTFQPFSRRVTLPDFKNQNVVKFGAAPELEKVEEGGEYKRGSISDGNTSYRLFTYGKVVAFTRQMVINDDLRALDRMPTLFGNRVRQLESDLVWEQITSNPTMGDSVALFHATHGNLGSGAIGETGISAGEAAMLKQTGLDSAPISVAPMFLMVPVALKVAGEKFLATQYLATKNSDINPFAGRFQLIAERRLDANSATAWYLAGSPSQVDIVEYGYLEGENGPYMETREGFDVDGVEMKIRHDFAAKVIDHVGLYKSTGV